MPRKSSIGLQLLSVKKCTKNSTRFCNSSLQIKLAIFHPMDIEKVLGVDNLDEYINNVLILINFYKL